MDAVVETYSGLSEGWFTHATPTLFNSGTPKPQMSSCFLLTAKEDSISGIYDTLKQCAKISQNAGGIGLSIHDIRATGSYIKGTNGTSNGIVPMFVSSMIPLDTLTKEVESAKGRLLFTSSPGMPTSTTSSTSKRTMEKRNSAHAIFFMRSGFQTFSCRGLKKMAIGH